MAIDINLFNAVVNDLLLQKKTLEANLGEIDRIIESMEKIYGYPSSKEEQNDFESMSEVINKFADAGRYTQPILVAHTARLSGYPDPVVQFNVTLWREARGWT